MSRAHARIGVVTVVALVLVGVPQADARPLAAKARALAPARVTAGWLDAAGRWVDAMLRGLVKRESSGTRPTAPTSTVSPLTTGEGGGGTSNTGSCIDPLGCGTT